MTAARFALKRIWSASDGATALEFALVAPLLFLLVTGTVEIALIYSAQNAMESATFSASRLGKTGRVADDLTREEAIRKELNRLAGNMLDTKMVKITSSAYKNFDEIGQPEPFIDANNNGQRDNGENYTDSNKNKQYDEDRGSAGYGATSEIVVYSVSYPWRVFTPVLANVAGADGTVMLTSRAVVKNEPY